jgi:hypothetical protein
MSPEDAGREFLYQIEWTGPTGSVDQATGRFKADTQPAHRSRTTVIVRFYDVTFPVAGDHQIRVVVDGSEIITIPVLAVERPTGD